MIGRAYLEMPRATVTDLRRDPGEIPEELLLWRHLPPLQHTGLMTMAILATP